MDKKDDGQWATNIALHRDPLHGIRKNTAIASKSKKKQPTESMKSQFRLQRSANSTMQKSRPKKSRPKKSPYKRQRIRRQSSDRTKSISTMQKSRPKKSPYKRQRIRRQSSDQTESMKTQHVTIDEIQQRIRRELIRQQ